MAAAASGSDDGSDGAQADQGSAPDYQKYPECGYASHPVDVVTGRAFTHPFTHLDLPGPLPLVFQSMYSTSMAHRDAGLGYGWAHTFGWEIDVGRREITVWNEQGVAVCFPWIPVGGEVLSPWGWVLRREPWGFAVDADDGLWRLFSATDERARRYRLTAIEDRNKNRIALTYDESRLVEITDSAGRILRVVSTGEGRIASIQALNARSQGQRISFVTFAYDINGNLVRTTDAEGHACRFAYDDDHRLTADADRTGLTFHFVYDSQGRCVEARGDTPGREDPSLGGPLPVYLADGTTRWKGIHHCRFDYSPGGYTEVADATEVRRFFGNRHGTLDKRVEGGGVISAVYDKQGHIDHGNLITLVQPNGGVWRFTYDAFGRRLASTDPQGATTRFAYSARGDLVAVYDPTGGVSRYEVDGEQHLIRVIGPGGRTTKPAWGGYHQLCGATDAAGHQVRIVYDTEGQPIAVLNETGERYTFEYSRRGHLIGERTFDGVVTRYRHDAEGHLLESVDALGGRRRFVRNLAGEITERHLPDGTVETFAYDPLGNIVASCSGAVEIRFKRDACGRVVREEQSVRGVVHSVERRYDPGGQRVARRTSLGYSEESRAKGDLEWIELSGGHRVQIARDLLGREITRHLPRGARIESSLDAGGRVLCRRVLGPGVPRPRSPDEPAWVGPLPNRTTVDRAYRYDAEGELVEVHDARTGRIDYRLDPIGQLLAALLERAREEPFRIDALGNLHEIGEGGESPRTYGPGSRLLRKGSTEYRWNALGQLVEQRTTSPESRAVGSVLYAWNAAGQLAGMTLADGRRVDFAYDPFGRRIEKRVAMPLTPGAPPVLSATTRFVWDADVLVHELKETLGSSGGPVVEERTYWFEDDSFVPMAHREVRREDGTTVEGEWLHYVNDPAGTPERLIAPDGEVVCEL